ncbi:MAG: hypothetical protein GQ582_08045 [Methyloprofundus sp.]|nr:hypothetical protein [Methyloprofundus sp.]
MDLLLEHNANINAMTDEGGRLCIKR